MQELRFSSPLVSGHSDPDPRHRCHEGVVPGDPRQAAGAKYYGSGQQQHRCHAG